MQKNEGGSILIEFVGSFLLFVLLIASVLNLVTVVTVQARMHYALTETAKTLSMYGYVLHVTKLENTIRGFSEGADGVRKEVNATIEDINGVLGDINGLDLAGIPDSAGAVGGRVAGWGDAVGSNPKQVLQYIMQYAGYEAMNYGFGEFVAEPLVKHFLSNDNMSGEEFLQSFRVKDDLQFYSLSGPGYTPAQEGQLVGTLTAIPDDDSYMLDANGNIRLTVQYEIEYSFFGLQLPWGDGNPTLKIVQSAMTKVWLGGKTYD